MAALEAAMRVKSLPVMPSRTSLEECKPTSSEFGIEKWSLHLDFWAMLRFLCWWRGDGKGSCVVLYQDSCLKSPRATIRL